MASFNRSYEMCFASCQESEVEPTASFSPCQRWGYKKLHSQASTTYPLHLIFLILSSPSPEPKRMSVGFLLPKCGLNPQQHGFFLSLDQGISKLTLKWETSKSPAWTILSHLLPLLLLWPDLASNSAERAPVCKSEPPALCTFHRTLG